MAEQNPAINAVTYIISTLKANSVNAQDIESGIEIPIRVFLLPCLIIRLEHKLPNKAPISRISRKKSYKHSSFFSQVFFSPKSDKLAIHEPSCSVMVRFGKCGENEGIRLSVWLLLLGNREAKAGDV